MQSTIRRTVAVLAVGVTAAGLLTTTGTADAAALAPPTSVPRAAGTDGARSVTLLTGDVVRVDATGEPTLVSRPTAGVVGRVARHVPIARYQRAGDWYAMPTDAVPLVESGLLDQRLFNVTDLVRQGYDDAGSSVVPLLVQHSETVTDRPLAGTKARRVLPYLKLTANDQSKADTARFWAELLRQADPEARAVRGGVRKVWLNARYRANLERSVPQVGAPRAWQAGLTGKGVTVAVLDSGYDTDHPDLVGRVSTAKNFSESTDVDDRFGHGTHVASTVAGSGAASGGRHRGVAPDAKLAVGKVLGDDGWGTEDAILAGMEWAVTEAGAKVVNMSFGGAPSDGTDPLSQAVDQLSAMRGALFVAAAGNNGPYAPVSSPAIANSALAVSSVDRTDRISTFSSRAPRLDGGAMKPELAAPGEGIVAGRATGTYPDIAGHADYVPLSGTSMAAPHVAGGAAILAQQHPDWTGAQLKAALVSSAAPAEASRVFDVGAGRLDVGRAVTQPVRVGSASVYADLPWGGKSEPRDVTYDNDSSAPVTLKLALSMTDPSGRSAPDGLAATSAATVTVPAHGSATVSVGFRGSSRAGSYGGLLVATADGVTLRTPVAVRQQAQTHAVDIRVLDSKGTVSESAHTMIVGSNVVKHVHGSGSLSLPTGRYTFLSDELITRPDAGPVIALVATPQVAIAGRSTVTQDIRWAHPVPLAVADRDAATDGQRAVSIGAQPEGAPNPFGILSVTYPGYDEIWAGSAPGVQADEFSLVDSAVLERPELALRAGGGAGGLPVLSWWLRSRPGPAPFVGTTELPVTQVKVDSSGRPAEVDVNGKLAVLTAPDGTGGGADLELLVRELQKRGARMAMVADGGFSWQGQQLALPTIGAAIGHDTVTRFVALAAGGRSTATVTGNQVSPYRYTLGYQERGSIPTDLAHRPRTGDLAAVPTSYHNTSDEWRQVFAVISLGGEDHAVLGTTPVPSPLRRIEYYTPGRWRISVADNDAGDTARTTLDLRPGDNPELVWGKAVVGPALAGANPEDPWASRKDNVLDVALPVFSDAAGHPALAHELGMTGTTSLYRNGNLVGTVAQPGRGQFGVPSGAAYYRLTTEAAHNSSTWPLSTKVSGSWTFRSGTEPTRTVLPMLGITVDAPVDLRNAVPVGEPLPVRISVHRQAESANPAVASLTVDVSYDDGRTWRRVPAIREGGSWRAQVPHGRAGFVSLRTCATDTNGNSVQQTVVRAYRIGS
ncbi:S8 family serine peptidase [Micromonospora sp. NPDC047670]|uniref:S8 family serine peptidase n=1 Tax=Micromonospora sp. NPDC047670 TaxID=3364252 RepID=UPI00371A28F9